MVRVTAGRGAVVLAHFVMGAEEYGLRLAREKCLPDGATLANDPHARDVDGVDLHVLRFGGPAVARLHGAEESARRCCRGPHLFPQIRPPREDAPSHAPGRDPDRRRQSPRCRYSRPGRTAETACPPGRARFQFLDLSPSPGPERGLRAPRTRSLLRSAST